MSISVYSKSICQHFLSKVIQLDSPLSFAHFSILTMQGGIIQPDHLRRSSLRLTNLEKEKKKRTKSRQSIQFLTLTQFTLLCSERFQSSFLSLVSKPIQIFYILKETKQNKTCFKFPFHCLLGIFLCIPFFCQTFKCWWITECYPQATVPWVYTLFVDISDTFINLTII